MGKRESRREGWQAGRQAGPGGERGKEATVRENVMKGGKEEEKAGKTQEKPNDGKLSPKSFERRCF